jgi:hypothetical protein
VRGSPHIRGGPHVRGGAHWGPRVGPRWGAPVRWGPAWPGWNAGWRWGPGVGWWGPGWWGWGVGWPGWGACPWGVGTAVIVGQTTSIDVGPLWADPVPQTLPFIEQQQAPTAPAAPATSPTGYWYYCTEPAGYFPYVKDCREPWLKVIPAPPGEQPSLAVRS